MKSKNLKVLFAALLAISMAGIVSAQFDDIYFDPDNADEVYAAVELEKYYDDSDYESSSVEDDYEYYYSSRIRRFDRSYYGFDFYSPVYVDPFYYNPSFAGFYRPGSSIYWGGAYGVPVTRSNVWVNSGFGWGAPVSYGVFNSWGPAYGAPINGGFVNTGFYGGAGFPVANGFSGASFGGFGGGGFAGGGYNAYCPPAVGSIYGNTSTGVFRPGNVGNVGNPNPRGGSATSSPVYGPRGGAGSVTGSPRSINNNRGGTVTGPDRPLTTSASGTQSPRAGQRTTATNSGRVSSSTVAGSPRRNAAYTPPSWISRQNASRSSRSGGVSSRSNSSSRYSATPPSRPSRSSYSPSSSSSRNSWNSTRSSSSSRSSFSSPRSSSRSSFSSPRSSGGSSRSSGASRSSGGRGGR